MAASETNTWDIALEDGGPRRPSLDDTGGATLEDEEPLPDKDRHPYADQLNQLQHQAYSQGKVAAACKLAIGFDAGAPFVSGFTAAGNLVTLDTFTVTDNGDGDTSVTWPAGTFPPAAVGPQLTIHEDVDDLVGRAFAIANGVQVKTKIAGGAMTDAACTVVVEG